MLSCLSKISEILSQISFGLKTWKWRYLGNWKAQKPKIFIHLIPVSCFVYNMVCLYLGVHCVSVESLGTQLNLHVPLPLMVVERSKNIHRRGHFFYCSEHNERLSKNLQKHKKGTIRSNNLHFSIFHHTHISQSS